MINAIERTGQQGFVRILIGESDDVNAFVLQCEVSKLNVAYSLKRIGRQEEFEPALHDFAPDLVIMNYAFGGPDLVATARDKVPHAPIILIAERPLENSDSKEGITDYVLKSQLSRLLSAIERALESRNGFESMPKAARTVSAPEAFLEAAAEVESHPAKFTSECKAPAPMIERSVAERLARIKERLKAVEPHMANPPVMIASQQQTKPAEARNTVKLQSPELGESAVQERFPEDSNGKIPEKSPYRSPRNRQRGRLEERSSDKSLMMAAEFRALFDGALDAVMIFDDEGTCRQANLAASNLLGLTQAEIMGRRLSDFSEPASGPLLAHAWQAFVSRGDQKGEKRLVLPNGTIRDIEYCARIQFCPGHHLLIARDITTRKRQEDEIKRLREEIEKLNTERSTHLQTCAKHEAKIQELSQAEESARRSKEEANSAIAAKNAQVKETLEQIRVEIGKRKQAEENARLFHEQLEKNVAKRTADLESSNNELRVLSRYLQLAREEERRRLTHYVQDELGEHLGQLSLEVDWLRKRLEQSEDGFSRRQLMEFAGSMRHLLTISSASFERIRLELGQWAKTAAKA